MSKDNQNKVITSAIAAMARTPMFIDEQGCHSLLLKYTSFVENISISEEVAKSALEKNRQDCSVKFYNAQNSVYQGSFSEDFSKVKEGSIALVPVMGAMMRDDYCDMSLNFIAGTRSLERTINELNSNSNVEAIVFHVVTPGGQSMGNESLANVIKQTSKPTLVYFEMMASAGVYSFTGVNEIYAAESDSMWGSIGTYMTLYDDTEFLKSIGIDIKSIYASESTEKNKEYRAAIDGDNEPMIEWLDKSNQMFIDHVKASRPSIKDDGLVFKGKIYTAKEAKKIGAIDGINSLEFVINRARKLAKKSKTQSKSMQNGLQNNILKMEAEEKKASFWSSIFGDKDNKQVEGDLTQLKQELDSSNLKNTELQNSLEQKENALEELTANNKELTANLEAAAIEVSELKSKVTELEANNEKLVEHNKELGAATPAATPVDSKQETGKSQKSSFRNTSDWTQKAKEVQQEMESRAKG